MHKQDLDPFRAVLGVIAGKGDSDILVSLMASTGLTFNASLTNAEAYSHKTRIRALLPRILNAYEALSDQSKLAAARAVLATLTQSQQYQELAGASGDVLRKIGWELRGAEIVVTTPDLREMFFPKGSPWDAFVVLRDIFAEAKNELTIVDSYADGTIYQMLSSHPLHGLTVRILCSKYASAVAAEAKPFVAQHPGMVVEVRQTKDFHDRFVVIDGQNCVHVGASIKDAGKTAFMVSRVEDDENRRSLLAATSASWNAATPVT